MIKNRVRIKILGYDHYTVDQSISKIIEVVEANGVKTKGPIPLPTKRDVFTVLRGVHKHKDSREQFEMRTHRRIIELINPNKKTLDNLSHIKLPSSINIEIKL